MKEIMLKLAEFFKNLGIPGWILIIAAVVILIILFVNRYYNKIDEEINADVRYIEDRYGRLSKK